MFKWVVNVKINIHVNTEPKTSLRPLLCIAFPELVADWFV